ncbi:hypothetical protein OAA60_01460 [Porticoccaceae bacterium]|nr:hypothetical protein [Porticoccaceae bacterium]
MSAQTSSSSSSLPPDNFCSAMERFIADIQKPFPELTPVIKRWWKTMDDFDNEENQLTKYNKSREISLNILYKYCNSVYPQNIQVIMTQQFPTNEAERDIDIEFLPNIPFRALFSAQISSDTKTAIWNYLILIACSLNSDNNIVTTMINNMFPSNETNVDADETNQDETNDHNSYIDELFNNLSKMPHPETTDTINSGMSDFLNTKLGSITKTIADKALKSFPMPKVDPSASPKNNEDMMKEQLENIMKNPDVLMNIMKDAKQTLDESMASGDLTQEELMSEVGNMLNTMGGIPGLGNLAGGDIAKAMMSQMAPNIVPSSKPSNEDVRKFQEMREKLHKAADKKGIKLNK